jgi:succinate-acetate transporter protein
MKKLCWILLWAILDLFWWSYIIKLMCEPMTTLDDCSKQDHLQRYNLTYISCFKVIWGVHTHYFWQVEWCHSINYFFSSRWILFLHLIVCFLLDNFFWGDVNRLN